MNTPVLFSQIVPAELAGLIANALRPHLAPANTAAPEPEELLTRKDAAGVLRITLPTLREYTNRGILKGYRLGSRVRYKRSEVIAALSQMKTAAR